MAGLFILKHMHDLSDWRQRLGEEQLVALIQESLSVAPKTGALATRDLERVVVDTTVQPKTIRIPPMTVFSRGAVIFPGSLAPF